jgi:hypothetical protein
MRLYLSVASYLLFLTVTCPRAPGQEIRLSYDLQSGVTYLLDIDIQQNTLSESVYSDEVNMSSRIRLAFTVDSTDSYGLVHMRARYSRLQLSVLAPGMGLDMNSGSAKNPVLSDLIDSLEQNEFWLTMNASGELRDLIGLNRVFREMRQFPDSDSSELSVILETLEEAYGPNTFQGLFNIFVGYFPVLSSMTNWTQDITYYFNTKPVQMVNRYTLSRSTGDVLTIQGLGMLQSEEDYPEILDLGKVTSSVSGSQTYDFHADIRTGWLKTCVSRQRILIKTIVRESDFLPEGLEIPSYTETLFEVKGSIQNPR